ncbi:MAG TPA: sugar ABC transporter permease [Candidatus Faeciplasma avium]|uniref:Sugar ABC transporter permease n=1 Tax=Candidatus Faeciplasma avium TaxID=2840798 RepID=A0A9D1T3C4_9FIRM|nr:sugar ABC transporter permease [Candidatus Faeciplasma avium]
MAENANATVKASKKPVAPKAPKAPKAASGPKEKKPKGLKISYERRKMVYGYGFLAIWIIGTIYFFIKPLIVSFIYSLNETSITLGAMQLKFIGIQNYIDTFTKDTDYVDALLAVLKDTLWKTPLIIIFSIFIAVILNQKFRGRTFARAVFFLPVIIATGPVMSIINGDMDSSGYAGGADQFSTMFETDMAGALLRFLGVYNISDSVTEVISLITSDIFNLVWNSGIQIIIFLAALQNIPFSAKEAAQIEGATGWEFFWKITLPYISPMIIANLIYTIVDSFIDPANGVMALVLQQASAWNHGYSAAMAWAYFLIVILALGIVLPIVNKFVYYEV